jgi:GNAT superfamily N-acetyltransferase
MESLTGDRREAVRLLYSGYPGLHGAIEAVLEGGFGQVFVDDAAAPRVARMVVGDSHMVAGDPGAAGAVDTLLAVPSGEYISVPEPWHEFVRRTLPRAEAKERFSLFAPKEWNRAHLAGLRESLPLGYELRRVDEASVEAFRDLNETFVDNFASLEDYLQRGTGFAITNEHGEIVAGCSTYTISSRCLEFEIETHVDYQRRGLALVTGARMIEHCIEAGLEPCWDAAHDGSARLAERLGFVGRRQYTAYRLP